MGRAGVEPASLAFQASAKTASATSPIDFSEKEFETLALSGQKPKFGGCLINDLYTLQLPLLKLGRVYYVLFGDS